MMPSLQGTRIDLVPLEDAVRELRTVPVEDYEEAAAFFG
jgi:6-phosphofructokinase 1